MAESKDLLKMLLWAAWEESDLYVVLGEVNTEFPDLTQEQKTATARSTVEQLLSRGWISLYRYKWPRGDWQTIDSKDYESILLNQASWAPPGEGEWAYCIDVTEQGKRQIMKPD